MFNRRVPKTHPRVEAYGTVDELSAALGLARATTRWQDIGATLLQVQKDLIQLSGELATDDLDRERLEGQGLAGLDATHLAYLDEAVATWESRLPPIRHFLQPGQNLSSAHLHFGRTVCRRAERALLRLREGGGWVSPLALAYFNRLSDFLWLAARAEEVESSSW